MTAFKAAEECFEKIPGDRFRRLARAFRVKAEAPGSIQDRVLGIWAASMRGGNRIVGSFVPKLPVAKFDSNVHTT